MIVKCSIRVLILLLMIHVVGEAYKSTHQSIMPKIQNVACEGWIGFDTIIKQNMTIFEC